MMAARKGEGLSERDLDGQSRWIANKRFPIGERQIDTRLDDLDSGIADQYVNAAFLTRPLPPNSGPSEAVSTHS
jgi:hypothetical protein